MRLRWAIAGAVLLHAGAIALLIGGFTGRLRPSDPPKDEVITLVVVPPPPVEAPPPPPAPVRAAPPPQLAPPEATPPPVPRPAVVPASSTWSQIALIALLAGLGLAFVGFRRGQ